MPVDGGSVWAQDAGGDGTPVVLLHPGWGDSRIWDSMLAVAGQPAGRCRFIRYDVRGFGRSPAPAAPYTLLADLIAVLDYLEVDQAVLVGHSMGGGTAIGFALAFPQRVSGLILVAPGIGDYPWPPEDPYGTEFEKAFAADSDEDLIALGLRTWAAAGHDLAAQAQVRSAVAAFSGQEEYERPDPPAYSRLGELEMPVALAIGELDYPMVIDAGRMIAERIPRCRTVQVPAADHLLPLRAPRLLADLIGECLPGPQ